jgi:hypothetical protein
MRRIIFQILVLIALCALAANGSPTHAAKAHKKTLPAATAHSKQSRAAGKASARPHSDPDQPRSAASRRSSRSVEPAPLASRRLRRGSRRFQTAPERVPDSSAAENTNQPEVKRVSLLRPRFNTVSPLRGTYESLVRQNQKTEADGLERIEDDNDLNDRIARQMLVPVPASATIAVNGSLPLNRRYCRPWTAAFLRDLGRAHNAQFHHSLFVSSAVRTVAYQKQLIQVNGNAASAEGDIASPHLTGATIDIAKQGMSRNELGWMRTWLLPLQEAGKIDVEEEFQQSCFHITVYKIYAPAEAELKPVSVAVGLQSPQGLSTSGPASSSVSTPGQGSAQSAPSVPAKSPALVSRNRKSASSASAHSKRAAADVEPAPADDSKVTQQKSAPHKRRLHSTSVPVSSPRAHLRGRHRRVHAE